MRKRGYKTTIPKGGGFLNHIKRENNVTINSKHS